MYLSTSTLADITRYTEKDSKHGVNFQTVIILSSNHTLMSILDKLLAMFATIVALLSIINQDWMWLGVFIIGLALFCYLKGAKLEYDRFLVVMVIVPLAAQSVLGVLMFYEWTNTLWIISLIFQTWIFVVYGYMLALLIDRFTDITLSKRWILLLSLLFAVFMSGLYLFLQFTSLYNQGFPVFNFDFTGSTSAERIWMNAQLMTPPSVAVPVSIIIALIFRQWTKKTDKSEMLLEGATNE